jgi:Amt family ammonium transporter
MAGWSGERTCWRRSFSGYSLAFGPTVHGLIGRPDHLFLDGLANSAHGTVPAFAFVAFQMMFAVITPALISGAFAERISFRAYVVFIIAWSMLVYVPVAHWMWADGGWLHELGAMDFAGGIVVHLTAGLSALVCAIVVGKRLGYPKHRVLPHDLTMTLTGAGLLWFGWFGFNAGSAPSSGHVAALAFVTTHLGASGGALGWLAVEWRHRGKPTALGVASGLVAGLATITPAAGFVAPWAALVIGLAAGAVCYRAVLLKDHFGYDDSLDAFGVHGVGGVLGALLTGVFAQKVLNADGADGALFGNVHQLVVQATACAATGVYSIALTFGIVKAIDRTIGLRVPEADEREGLDATQHGEEAYVDAVGIASDTGVEAHGDPVVARRSPTALPS